MELASIGAFNGLGVHCVDAFGADRYGVRDLSDMQGSVSDMVAVMPCFVPNATVLAI